MEKSTIVFNETMQDSAELRLKIRGLRLKIQNNSQILEMTRNIKKIFFETKEGYDPDPNGKQEDNLINVIHTDKLALDGLLAEMIIKKDRFEIHHSQVAELANDALNE